MQITSRFLHPNTLLSAKLYTVWDYLTSLYKLQYLDKSIK